MIVTATGLQILAFGGIELVVDGEPVDLPATMAYKALMLSGVPNFVFTVGYTNASWTLKADLVSEYVVRLLRHLDEIGARSVVPVREPDVEERPFMDFTSGYVLRALDRLPRQGDRAPWRLKQNYLTDLRTIRRGRIDDGVLAFDRVPATRVIPLSPAFDAHRTIGDRLGVPTTHGGARWVSTTRSRTRARTSRAAPRRPPVRSPATTS